MKWLVALDYAIIRWFACRGYKWAIWILVHDLEVLNG